MASSFPSASIETRLLTLEEELLRRRHVEEDLRQSSERLRLLVEHGNEVVFRYLVQDRRFEHLSPGISDLTGHSASDFFSQPDLVLDLVHDEDRNLLRQYIDDADFARPLALRVRRADGDDVWIEMRALPGFDRDGQLLTLEGILRDVTGFRHLLESSRERGISLQERERLLTSLSRIGSAALESLDLDHVLDTLAEQVVRAGILRSLMVALVDEENRSVRVVRNFLSFEGRYGEGVGQVRAGATITESPTVARREGERLVFTDERIIGTTYDLDDDNITPTVARTGQFTVIDGPDDRFDERFEKDSDPAKRSRTVAYFLPVARGDRILAVLATASHVDDKEETLRRLAAMEPLLEQAAVALDHAMLHGRVRDDVVQLHSLNSRLRDEISRRLEAEEALRTFSQRTVQLAEEERRRVARELHDGVNQLLCGIGFRLESLGIDTSSADMEATRNLLNRSIQEVRRISQDLRPVLLDDLGLAAAVRQLCQLCQERTGADVSHDLLAVPSDLATGTAIAAYRLLQQALLQWTTATQSSRHVRVYGADDGLFLEIQGTPSGALPEEALRHMQEYAGLLGGSVDVSSRSENGTLFVALLPTFGGSRNE